MTISGRSDRLRRQRPSVERPSVERVRVDRGSATPVMMAVVACAVGAFSLTARVGARFLEMSRIDAAADAVALALAYGDSDLGQEVAERNQVRIINLEIVGDRESGFEVWVMVAAVTGPDEASMDRGYVGQARASTKP